MSTHHDNRRAQRGPKSERGSVLVIALMVILAMTGLGVIAFNVAVGSTRTAGSLTVSKQANFIAELAMMTALEELACSQDQRVDRMMRSLDGAGEGSSDWSSADGLCGQATDLFGEAPLGRRQGTAQFVVRFDDLRTARAAAGNAVNELCYLRVRLRAFGELDIDMMSTNVDGTAADSVIRRSATGYALIGPFPGGEICGGNY